MTPNYFNKASQNVPSVSEFQGMDEPKRKLRSHLKSIKRVLSLKRDKTLDNHIKSAIDYKELAVEAGPIRKASVDVQGEMVLRTVNSLLGLKVVSHADSNCLGKIQDLILCRETNEVLALILEDDTCDPGNTQIVPWSEICDVGKETVTVYRMASRMKLTDYPRAMCAAAGGKNRLTGTQVLTAEGQYLRMLADMCIDESSGCIVGYEVSEGFIVDTLQDKTFR